MKHKMEMAHEMALAMAADGNVPNENIVAIMFQKIGLQTIAIHWVQNLKSILKMKKKKKKEKLKLIANYGQFYYV